MLRTKAPSPDGRTVAARRLRELRRDVAMLTEQQRSKGRTTKEPTLRAAAVPHDHPEAANVARVIPKGAKQRKGVGPTANVLVGYDHEPKKAGRPKASFAEINVPVLMGTVVTSEVEARPGKHGYYRGYAPHAYRAPRAYGRVYAARPYGYGYGYRYRRPNYGAAAAAGVGAAIIGGLAAQQYYAPQPYYACNPYYGC